MPGVDTYTAAMFHCDGTNGSTAQVTDSSSIKSNLVISGNAQLATTTREFGTASLFCDGTNNTYALRGVTSATTPSGDFTIDYWMRINTLAVAQVPFAQTDITGAGFGSFATSVAVSSAKYFTSGSSNTAWDIISQQWGFPTTDVWEHWAVTRASSIFRFYQNGVLNATALSTLTPYQNTTNQRFILGAQAFNGPPFFTANFYNGYIDEFRFSNGIARWTGSTFALPLIAYDEWETEWDVLSDDRINPRPRIQGY